MSKQKCDICGRRFTEVKGDFIINGVPKSKGGLGEKYVCKYCRMHEMVKKFNKK